MAMNSYLKKKRLIFVCISTVIFTGIIAAKYAKLAAQKSAPPKEILPTVERGSIIDRNGKALAVSTNFYHFGVTPSVLDDIPRFVKLVSPLLGMSAEELSEKIIAAQNSKFVYLQKKMSQTTYEGLKQLCSKAGFSAAVRFDKIPGRTYPENDLASQVIGYMGDEGIGLAGIEYSEQSLLAPEYNPDAPTVTRGKNIYLTLDANLQFKLEKIARDAVANTQAASLMLVAAEAKTGEILSYISLPSSNLNEYTRSTAEERKDRPATESYEPGSVFKIFSIASFIDSGGISQDDSFLCDGVYERRTNSGERIRITCLDHHGWLTARGALKFSCNDALAQMSEHIESEQFLARIRGFGFGSRTGVELPGETAGAVHSTNDRLWSARSKPTMAIGQELTVSALQIVEAATTFANGGKPVQLTFINKITDAEGREEYVHVPVYKNQIIKKSTADYILSCMETVAESGTGHRASLGDVSIGVKTGTAQMADLVNGGYSETDFISNCIAIFPVENPEIILYIVIEKAKGETYAGRIVAPVIADAASTIIDHLGMSRGNAESVAHSGKIQIHADKPLSIGKTIPNFTGLAKRQLIPLLNDPNVKILIHGDGYVTRQTPAAGSPVIKDMEIELYLE